MPNYLLLSGELRSDDPNVPWADEIEQKLFLPPSIGVGNFVRFTECAFFHKKSRTLLVTDAVVYVNDKVACLLACMAALHASIMQADLLGHAHAWVHPFLCCRDRIESRSHAQYASSLINVHVN